MRANAEEEAGEFAPLPEGDYVLTCTGVQDKTTKTGKNMAVLELTVTEGPCANRKVWHNVTFIPEGEKGHGFLVNALRAFGLIYDGDLDFDTSEFRGRSCKARIVTEEREWDGKVMRSSRVSIFLCEDSEAQRVVHSPSVKAGIVANSKAGSEKVPF